MRWSEGEGYELSTHGLAPKSEGSGVIGFAGGGIGTDIG